MFLVVDLSSPGSMLRICDILVRIRIHTGTDNLRRVADPHLSNADPDRDPDPEFFQIVDPDPGFDDLKLKEFTAGNFIFIS